MTRFQWTILAAALVLSACGGATTNESAEATDNEAANASAPADANATKPEPAAEAPAAAGDGTLSRNYMVGRWSDSGDCTDVTEFRADGSFLYPWGDTGQWTLEGDQLTLTGNTDPLTIRVIDQNTLERTSASGRATQVTRCT